MMYPIFKVFVQCRQLVTTACIGVILGLLYGCSTATTPVPTPVPCTFTPAAQTPAPQVPQALTYQVVREYPHDANAFTQGFVIENGVLYESTGLYGESSLRRVKLTSGKVLQSQLLANNYFAEGLTYFDGRLYQLTWQNQLGFIYDANTFEKVSEFSYETEGWGLTDNGSCLLMSDGSPIVRYLDPKTMSEVGRIIVSTPDAPVFALNELEFIKGELYANVWQTNQIMRIDPASGQVTGIVDLTGLLPASERTTTTDVLNGIAYDAAQDKLYLTGKKWSKLFEVKFVPQP